MTKNTREKEIKANVGQFDATRQRQRQRQRRLRLSRVGAAVVGVSWPFANWQQQKYENEQGEGERESVRGRRRQMTLHRQGVRQLPAHFVVRKKNYFYMFDTHATQSGRMRERGRGRGRQVNGGVCDHASQINGAVWTVVAFPVCSCQKAESGDLMNSKLIRTICPLSAAAAH